MTQDGHGSAYKQPQHRKTEAEESYSGLTGAIHEAQSQNPEGKGVAQWQGTLPALPRLKHRKQNKSTKNIDTYISQHLQKLTQNNFTTKIIKFVEKEKPRHLWVLELHNDFLDMTLRV